MKLVSNFLIFASTPELSHPIFSTSHWGGGRESSCLRLAQHTRQYQAMIPNRKPWKKMKNFLLFVYLVNQHSHPIQTQLYKRFIQVWVSISAQQSCSSSTKRPRWETHRLLHKRRVDLQQRIVFTEFFYWLHLTARIGTQLVVFKITTWESAVLTV